MADVIVFDDESSGRPDGSKFSRTPSNDGPVLGQWYWYTPDQKFDVEAEAEYSQEVRDRSAEGRKPWLGCAMEIGTNYVEIESPQGKRGHRSDRVHLEDFWTKLRHEPDADAVIRKCIGDAQQESTRLLGEVKDLTMRLGMAPMDASRTSTGNDGNALMVLSGTHDVKAYGRDLVLAKDVQLPALFDAIQKANETLSMWMKAPTMPMLAEIRVMKESVKGIDDRIFSVGLYAGLTEEVVQCCDGEAAQAHEKLHVMQRMAYMDEESLAEYRHGGMEFRNIEEFDQFMADPVNRDRILPFPRTIVAMRVRRNKKERDSFGSIRQAMVNICLANEDKLTFLYIRNGSQIWRLSCDFDFGELIFPERSVFDPHEPKMVKMSGGRVRAYMPVTEWEERKTKFEIGMANYNQWADGHPGNTWMDNPHREFAWGRHDFRPNDWAPVDHGNLYFDEVMEDIGKTIKKYNRVALIIQGLYDRSLVLHPHPPVQTWSAGGFDKAVKLVYDGSDIIAYGDAPDFEAYRARCNESMAVGSLVVGQDDFWERREAAKEKTRRDNDYRDKSGYRPSRFRPYGNPGPGYLARVAKLSKNGATFKWEREKVNSRYGGESVACTLTVPLHELFNVDAYKLGDYKQFFSDSRTRQHYIKWAPLLIAAEEHVASLAAGKI